MRVPLYRAGRFLTPRACPWCGPKGDVMVMDPEWPSPYRVVQCLRCGGSGPKHEDSSEAVREWNRLANVAQGADDDHR